MNLLPGASGWILQKIKLDIFGIETGRRLSIMRVPMVRGVA